MALPVQDGVNPRHRYIGQGAMFSPPISAGGNGMQWCCLLGSCCCSRALGTLHRKVSGRL